VLGFYNPLAQHDSNRLECLLNLSCSVALIDYERARPTWTTESSNNISKVLEHLKLGLNDETTPDSLMYKDIGESIGRGSMKIAYTLKDHPDLLFLQGLARS
jgi:hypothetical protein